MPARLKLLYQTLGRIDLVFIALLVFYVVLQFAAPASGLAVLIGFFLTIAGVAVAVRLIRAATRKTIWRLRNRLLVAYLFIAVVPMMILLTLVASIAYWMTGQIAIFLINSELERRTGSLRGAAEAIARAAPENRADLMSRIGSLMLRDRYPSLYILTRQPGGDLRYPPDAPLTPPAPRNISGVVMKGDQLFSWAQVAGKDVNITLAVPLTHQFMASLVPGLGDVALKDFASDSNGGRNRGVTLKYGNKSLPLDQAKAGAGRYLPPAYNRFDVQVGWGYPLPVALWDESSKSDLVALLVSTRVSAVLRMVFGQKVENLEIMRTLFIAGLTLFLILELVSVIIGISITRTITHAVHDLYEGTQWVKEGDFTHRIPVTGGDQLAELSASFNTMTENLGRLIVVAKEKERLQSELEIAREVQGQLFPKELPNLRTLELTGVCNPARMVSGDYYDYLMLADSTLAFAIGDVAGKGISAALLMAAIQSTMRTQLTAGIPMAVAAGNGGGAPRFSTAALVSQLNKQLYANTSPEKYATFYFALYDEETSMLTYTNAGHLEPILVRDGQPHMLEVTGTVVGAFPFARYEEKQLPMRARDLLVAYTDGITEPQNEYGEMFGAQRLKDVLVRYTNESPGEIIARVMEAVRQWTGPSAEAQDDMTMVVARRV